MVPRALGQPTGQQHLSLPLLFFCRFAHDGQRKDRSRSASVDQLIATDLMGVQNVGYRARTRAPGSVTL